MNIKVKSVLFFLALLLGSSSVFAQANPDRPKHDPEKRLERMTEDLDLTPDQQQAIREIEKTFQAEEEAIRKKHDTVRAESKALHDAKRKEMDKVLTPEQQTKLEAIHQERGPHHKGKKGKGPRKGADQRPKE